MSTRHETITEDECDRIEEMKRERLERKRRITRDISYEDGEQLVQSIHGIDRALNALEGIDFPDIGEEPRRKRNEDANELFALLQG